MSEQLRLSPGLEQVKQKYQEWQRGLPEEKLAHYEKVEGGGAILFCDFMEAEGTKAFLQSLRQSGKLTQEEDGQLSKFWENAAYIADYPPSTEPVRDRFPRGGD